METKESGCGARVRVLMCGGGMGQNVDAKLSRGSCDGAEVD
jgi:hypothetical protein